MGRSNKAFSSVFGFPPFLALGPSCSLGEIRMNDTVLFILGLIAFSLAVGPLAVAAYLDVRESKGK